MIIIDPGHGGRDKGASRIHSFKGVEILFIEKDINLKIADELFWDYLGFPHIDITRRNDTFHSLKERCGWANNKFDIETFVSIHCNAYAEPSVYGTEIWFHKGSKKGEALAGNIEDELRSVVPKWRGIKETGKFYVLKHTKMPAVLIECGFLSNKEEAVLLSLKSYQEKIAKAIATGIDNWKER